MPVTILPEEIWRESRLHGSRRKCHSLLNFCAPVLSCSVVSDSFAASWTVARQAPLSMEFSRQEYWSELLFPTPGDLPDSGIELVSPALGGGFFTTAPPGKPYICCGLENVTRQRIRIIMEIISFSSLYHRLNFWTLYCSTSIPIYFVLLPSYLVVYEKRLSRWR